MEGDLREFPLSEIPQFISLGSRTGILDILRRDGAFGVGFTGGIITGLTADGWTLADELRDSGLIPPDALPGLIAKQDDSHELRASILTNGHMTAEERTVFVARQVERLLYTLFDVREGTFRFRQGATEGRPWLPIRVSADRAVLEGTRWSDTWAHAIDFIPSPQSRFSRIERPTTSATGVSVTQWRVYVALSEPGTVPQMAGRSIMTEVEVVEALQSLTAAGLVQRTRP